MKNVFIFMLIFILAGSMAFAQDSSTVFSKSFFVGARYDNGFRGTFGVGTRAIGNVWVFPTTDWGGDQTTGAIEIAYIVNAGKAVKSLGIKFPSFFNNLYLGPIAGPNVDFIGIAEKGDEPAITYVTGATGVIGAYALSDAYGVWGYGKYSFELSNTSRSEDAINLWKGGVGFYIGF